MNAWRMRRLHRRGGNYDVIQQGKPGAYRVSLLKTFKDGLPRPSPAPRQHRRRHDLFELQKGRLGTSIVSVRFKMSDGEAMAKK